MLARQLCLSPCRAFARLVPIDYSIPLEAGEVGGIFNLERFVPINISGTSPPEYPQKTQEKRLFYSADFKVDRVDFHPDD